MLKQLLVKTMLNLILTAKSSVEGEMDIEMQMDPLQTW